MLTNPYLKHHGIEGQQWGVENGPPYPLNSAGKASFRRNRRKLKKIEKQEVKIREKELSLEKMKEKAAENKVKTEYYKSQTDLKNAEDAYKAAYQTGKKKTKHALRSVFSKGASNGGEKLVSDFMTRFGNAGMDKMLKDISEKYDFKLSDKSMPKGK